MRLMQLSGAVCDLVYRVAGLPDPGGEVVASAFAAVPGGGFNALVAARRQGMAAAYGGGIGTGPFAAIVRAGLKAEGTPPLMAPLAVDQGTCVVLVAPDGERSFVSIPGAEGAVSADALSALPPAPWVLLSGYTLGCPGGPAIAAHVAALPRETRLVFDPAPMVASIPAAILRTVIARADWITANRAEAAILTGTAEPDQASEALGPRAIVRDGPRGAWWAGTQIPGFPVATRDTTGAGDTHAGALIAALDRGEDTASAIRTANAAAALSTLRDGPATAPTLDETRAFLGAPATT
jgi:sugar/nucleoside kinase (ribokinase family)